jgi:hypothetical protein
VSALDQFRVGSPLAKLLAGRVRPHKLFSIEIARNDGRTTLPLAVRSLTADDAARAHADAIKWLVSTGGWQREDLIGDAGDAILNLEVMVQTLTRALVDPEKPDVAFAADAAEVRKFFEVDEIRAVWDEYASWSQERSPFRSLKTLAEVKEVADALGKGQASMTSLPRYEYTTLRSIITALVDQRATWTTANSSATSPPTDSPADSSESWTPTMTVGEVE